jgi:hypothetical protein
VKQKHPQQEKNPVELVEEAFQLLRQAPGPILVFYYLGTLPFMLALLYFWSDMARSPFAAGNLLTGTLGLTALFVWMKCWHAVFAQQLLASLCGEPAPRLTVAHLLRTAVHQAIVQPFGLFLLPAALALLVPLGWVYAFFTNATVFSSTAPDIRTLVRHSWQQARLWPLQSHYLVFMFKLFGFFVFLNLLCGVMAVPALIKVLLGIETVFTQSPWAALNTTLLTALGALTFLCLDPVLKASYVLRCFYGQSLQTGQDLKAELKTIRSESALAGVATLILVMGLTFAGTARAADTADTQVPKPETRNSKLETRNSIAPPDLDHSIDQVIQKREYSWRLPRREADAAEKEADSGEDYFETLFKQIGDGFKVVGRWIRDFVQWLNQLGPRPTAPNMGGFNFGAAMKGILFVLIVLLVGLIVWLLIRVWNQRDRLEEVAAEALPAMPDVSDENVGADQLAEEGWVKLARELLERGELRLALRAYYLATLAHLSERNLISLAKFKSNLDYQRELTRRAYVLPHVSGVFTENVSVFERVWYGLHDVTPEMLQHFSGNVERMKGA